VEIKGTLKESTKEGVKGGIEDMCRGTEVMKRR
jgi:hypothetical protein